MSIFSEDRTIYLYVIEKINNHNCKTFLCSYDKEEAIKMFEYFKEEGDTVTLKRFKEVP